MKIVLKIRLWYLKLYLSAVIWSEKLLDTDFTCLFSREGFFPPAPPSLSVVLPIFFRFCEIYHELGEQ